MATMATSPQQALEWETRGRFRQLRGTAEWEQLVDVVERLVPRLVPDAGDELRAEAVHEVLGELDERIPQAIALAAVSHQ